MDKNLFEELTQSLKEAGAIAQNKIKPSRRFVVSPPDVKAAREKTGLTQDKFASLIGVSLKTLQNWEQHRRNPTGAAATLITIVSKEPEVVLRTLHGGQKRMAIFKSVDPV